MLMTTLGTLITARGAPSQAAPAERSSSAGSSTVLHFTGSDGQPLGEGAWRFTLEPVPIGVTFVDYDGAPLYEGRSPGFTWDGASQLDLSPPGDTLPPDSQLHVHCSM